MIHIYCHYEWVTKIADKLSKLFLFLTPWATFFCKSNLSSEKKKDKGIFGQNSVNQTIVKHNQTGLGCEKSPRLLEANWRNFVMITVFYWNFVHSLLFVHSNCKNHQWRLLKFNVYFQSSPNWKLGWKQNKLEIVLDL